MKNQEQEKDIFLIAKKIAKQEQSASYDLQSQLDQRFQKESEEALKMINAYRKVQNLKPNHSTNKKDQKNTIQVSHQPKSTYANKIKQTLRQLNANKAKQYEKLTQKNSQINSNKNINNFKVPNQMGIKEKSQNQRKLITKSAQKFWNLFVSIQKRYYQESLRLINLSSQANLLQDYKMAKKYRIFRLFSLWKDHAKIMKIQNQKRRKEQSQKQIEGLQLAKEFFAFKMCKKVLKNWSRVTMNQKKKRKYEQEIKKVQTENKKLKKQQKTSELKVDNQNDPLQNKLKGFLNGLKEKIQHKEAKHQQLQSIEQKNEESQRQSSVFSQIQHQQNQNTQSIHQNEQTNDQQMHQNQPDHHQTSSQPQKPLSNQELQKRRQQIYQRSKNRKQALQKLKKEKQINKKKEEEERRQLQKQIQEQQKRIKQLKYKQFQERKRLQRQWQIRQAQLSVKAQEWNKLRIVKYYGFDHWKNLKYSNAVKAKKLGDISLKIMLRHAGQQFIENLQQNLEQVLSKLYTKMDFIYGRNLKRKSLKGYKLQKAQCIQQKTSLQAFHEVYTQKIFLSQWKSIMDTLRLQNLEEQRPLIKKANDYHKVSLMLKSLRELKKNAIESKKEKNIKDQKLKIKSKIKDIINEKIEINFEEFL